VRVAYVVDEWVRLSQTFVRQEVAELRRQGVTVEVVALGRGDVAPGPDEPATYLPDLVPRTRPARLAALLRNPPAAVALARAQARMRPERIRYRAALPAVAARLRRAEVTWVHAHFAWEAAGVAEALAALLGVGWSFTAHANDIFVANTHLAGKLVRADGVVTVCRYNEDHLRATYPTLPPVEIVVCGVEVPPPSGRLGGGPDVLAVGRLVPKKGFDLLVRAAAALHADHPDLTIEIVGDGPERGALEALAGELGVGSRVTFAGSRPHDYVLDRMARSRMVCLPARVADDGDRDSMPVVLKEAMARAVPVVATDVVAIPEMVDDSVGRLVPPDDAAALAGAIRTLVDDEPLGRALGQAGRARVEERFTLAGETGRLRRLFEAWSAAGPDQSTRVR
jgi:glycosyltransferase involved in cell wall biosynthesis